MNYRHAITMLVFGALLSACSAVYSPTPIGMTPVTLDPQSWDGTWRNADGSVELEVIDSAAGLLRAAWIEDMVLTRSDIHLQTIGDWMLGSAASDDKSGWFAWARVKKEDDRITLWVPSVPKFAALVKDGTLPGKVDEGGDVLLGELSSEQLELIASETRGVLFAWDDPLVFWRLGD